MAVFRVGATPWEQIAGLHLLEYFEASYEGSRCDICNSLKWKNSFFCRKCSIKLQRAHLMSKIARLNRKDWMSWKMVDVGMAAKHWDLCRDYLLNTRKHLHVERLESDADSE